jgi:hypothetical protein
MSVFGFTFPALYCLEVGELQDLARLIKGEGYFPLPDKEVLVRGVIIPFLREASKAPRDASKDQVMQIALTRVAKALDVQCDDWDTVDTKWLMRQVKERWMEAFKKQFQGLDEELRREILRKADEELKRRAARMGVSLLPAAGVVIGELSGFGIYLATTTGLGAISTAIGLTFPWAVYQGATTLLGVALGPIGWALAGAGAVLTGGHFLWKWFRRNEEKLKVVVVGIITAIGDDPYEWFGLSETASMDEVKRAYRAMMKTFHPDVLQELLPEWVKLRFNELLLQTQEHYERIQKHKEGLI